MWQKVNFKQSSTDLNSKFSFSWTGCHTNVKESSWPNYLPVSWWGIIGFIPFPRGLALYAMQPVTSRIWTLVAVSISNDSNQYTLNYYMYIKYHFNILWLIHNVWLCLDKEHSNKNLKYFGSHWFDLLGQWFFFSCLHPILRRFL